MALTTVFNLIPFTKSKKGIPMIKLTVFYISEME